MLTPPLLLERLCLSCSSVNRINHLHLSGVSFYWYWILRHHTWKSWSDPWICLRLCWLRVSQTIVMLSRWLSPFATQGEKPPLWRVLQVKEEGVPPITCIFLFLSSLFVISSLPLLTHPFSSLSLSVESFLPDYLSVWSYKEKARPNALSLPFLQALNEPNPLMMGVPAFRLFWEEVFHLQMLQFQE